MTATAKREPESSLIYFVLLVILLVFFLARPPLLMLWDRVTNGGLAGPENHFQDNQATNGPGVVGRSNIPAKPKIIPPALPISLSGAKLPARWTPFDSSSEMLALSERIIEFTNNERSQMGLAPLKTDTRLSEIAAFHSRDMVENAYIAHISKDGDGPSQRVGRLHRTLFGGISENLAYYESEPPKTQTLAQQTETLARQFVSQWMNSLGHRRNILRETSTHIGVGCFDRPKQGGRAVERKCTQLFSETQAYAAKPVPEVVSQGGSLQISLDPAQFPGAPMPTAILQFDLATDSPISNGQPASFNRTPAGMLVADLPVTGPPGVYSVSLRVPDAANPNRYWIIPGSYFILQ